MDAPYREEPRAGCPRCGEALEPVIAGASSCLACEGLWLSAAILDAAFGTPHWPTGDVLRGRSALACPTCEAAMESRHARGAHVERCPDHGLWIDRADLARLLAVGDGLAALRARVASEGDVEQLVARREKWRAELEAQRRAAAAYRASLAKPPKP